MLHIAKAWTLPLFFYFTNCPFYVGLNSRHNLSNWRLGYCALNFTAIQSVSCSLIFFLKTNLNLWNCFSTLYLFGNGKCPIFFHSNLIGRFDHGSFNLTIRENQFGPPDFQKKTKSLLTSFNNKTGVMFSLKILLRCLNDYLLNANTTCMTYLFVHLKVVSSRVSISSNKVVDAACQEILLSSEDPDHLPSIFPQQQCATLFQIRSFLSI
jgi:hypothetical protein